MSLVAYGSSDESDEECQDSATFNNVSSKTDLTDTNSKKTETGPNSTEKPFTSDIEGREKSDSENGMFSSIPAPKLKVISQDNEKMDNLPMKKTTVKISVPSLSEFKDDDTEPTKKKLKPSSKGSGLFALLPAPKNVFLKGSKSSDGTKTQAPLVPRAINKPLIKTPPVIPKRFLKPSDDEIITEEDKNSLDFFSLGSLNDVPDEVDSITELSGSTNSKLNLPPPRLWALPEAVPEQSTVSMEEPSSSNSEENDNFLAVDNGNIQLSEEALHKLCGRRATRQQQEVEVIDVSGAELLPDPTEWLTKQLTEERHLPSRGFGRRHDGPTSQQRRKHQITYLAFQAKENELELKNQWSQNRMSRKQTQSKYGF